jgi:RNA polymerase-binding transcription factor DksA
VAEEKGSLEPEMQGRGCWLGRRVERPNRRLLMSPWFQREVVRVNLGARRRELAAELRSHDAIRVVRASDHVDETNLAVDRELATTELERRFLLWRQVGEALARLDAGEYGWCLRCGAAIAAERLSAVPWTPHCRRCQETAEKEQRAALAAPVPGR